MSGFANIPLMERPREKAKIRGIESLSNQELLAIILRTGSRESSVMELATYILQTFCGIKGIINTSYAELTKIKGMKESKSLTLMATIEFSRRINHIDVTISDIVKVISPNDVYNLLSGEMENAEQERLYVLFLNTKNILIAYKELFIGGLDYHVIHPRDIFREAVKFNAAKIILSHNHPSGDPNPSKNDVESTKTIFELGNALGTKLIDHIIIGRNCFFSMKSEELF